MNIKKTFTLEDAAVRVFMPNITGNTLRIMRSEFDVKRKDSVLLKLMLRNAQKR